MTTEVKIANGIPRRILLKAAMIACLLTGVGIVTDATYLVDKFFYGIRASVAQKELPSDIMLVGIDDKSLAKHGGWPWDRKILADAVTKLDKAGAEKILFDVQFLKRGDGNKDPLQAAADNASADVYFGLYPEEVKSGSDHIVESDSVAKSLVPQSDNLVYLGVDNDLMNMVWTAPRYAKVVNDENSYQIPSLAEAIANEKVRAEEIDIDYNFSRDVKKYSFSDIDENLDLVKGKRVVIFPQAYAFNDTYRMPFGGFDNGVMVHVLAAATMESHTFQVPEYVVIMAFFVVLVVVFAAKNVSKRTLIVTQIVTCISLLAFVSVAERFGTFINVTNYMFWCVSFVTASNILFNRMQRALQSTTDSLTGLPSGAVHVQILESLGKKGKANDRVIVGATIGNSNDISCLLSEDQLIEFYHEVERRILSSNGTDTIYHASYDSVTWDVSAAIFPGADDYARALRAMMLQPFVIGEHTIRADLSYGFDMDYAVSPYRRLANALNAAQRAASENQLYEGTVNRDARGANWRIALTSEVENLIAKEQFKLAFQPKLALRTGEVNSAECLLRWTHPDFGTIPPSEFIEVAEQGSAIQDLTQFALRRAMSDLVEIRKSRPNFQLAVNLSPRMLDDAELPQKTVAMLEFFGLDREAIIFEITEAANLTDVALAMEILTGMVNEGMALSIDDYGTGRSTLDYLRLIPAREVKLDRSFIADMVVSKQSRDLVESTINLAHTLGMVTVAEGVENQETMAILRGMGCDYVQGYHVGWPLFYDEFVKKFVVNTYTYAA